MLETAIVLARMYGIKETLEPLPGISNEEVVVLIEKWAKEFLETGEHDIIQFFESRFEIQSPPTQSY